VNIAHAAKGLTFLH